MLSRRFLFYRESFNNCKPNKEIKSACTYSNLQTVQQNLNLKHCWNQSTEMDKSMPLVILFNEEKFQDPPKMVRTFLKEKHYQMLHFLATR